MFAAVRQILLHRAVLTRSGNGSHGFTDETQLFPHEEATRMSLTKGIATDALLKTLHTLLTELEQEQVDRPCVT